MLTTTLTEFGVCHGRDPSDGDRGFFFFVPFLSFTWEDWSELFGAGTPKSSCYTACVIKGCHLFDLGSFDSFED